MQKNTIISIFVSLVLIGGTLFLVSDRSVSSPSDNAETQNVEIKDGVQYVTITAKGGYYPRFTQIKGGIQTKLIVKTNGTYDCSAALIVRPLGFQKILQATGEEIIDAGIPKVGDTIKGVCGMGMYSFQIKVS